MKVKKFRQKLMFFEAVQWSGIPEDIKIFKNPPFYWKVERDLTLGASDKDDLYELRIDTRKGLLVADPTDWIIDKTYDRIVIMDDKSFQDDYEEITNDEGYFKTYNKMGALRW